jgi:hypothetical protein
MRGLLVPHDRSTSRRMRLSAAQDPVRKAEPEDEKSDQACVTPEGYKNTPSPVAIGTETVS